MADWSLPSDLANRVAGRFLATNDLDWYMDFRAVCRTWRSATADPRAHPGEPRFFPCSWVTLDEVKQPTRGGGGDDDTRLFVNTATGRFLRKRLPVLRCYHLVTTTPGGFFVLADRKSPHAARVLNPFTGSMTPFMAPVPRETYLTAVVVPGSGNSNSPFSLVLASDASHRVYWALPESPAFLFDTCHGGRPSSLLPCMAKGHAGRKHGSAVTDADDEAPERVDPVWSSAELEQRLCAVDLESTGGGGETLVVSLKKSSNCVRVLKVAARASEDEEVRLERGTSIGNHALLVGDRCLLVEADKLPSVEANCVYNQMNDPDGDEFFYHGIFVDDLNAGKAEMIAESVSNNPLLMPEHPLTLIQLLAKYTMYVPRYGLMEERRLQRLPTLQTLREAMAAAHLGLGFGDDEFEFDE